MIATSPAHIALLQTRIFWAADLIGFTLIDGSVLRYNTGGINLSYGGFTWSGAGPIIRRGALRVARGLDTDELNLTIHPRDDHTLLGLPWRHAVRNGALDGAQVELWRVHAPAPGAAIVGGILRYAGTVADVDIDEAIAVTVKSALARLGAPFPRAVYQPGCDRTLYDAGCGLARASFQNTGTVGIGSTAKQLNIALSTAKASGFYTGGELRCVTGLNAGAVRTIRTHLGASFNLAYPLDHLPAATDAVQLWPGCSRTIADCRDKFANLVRFTGKPFVPSPETAL